MSAEQPWIAAVDVDYQNDQNGAGADTTTARAACVLFRAWDDAEAAQECTTQVDTVAGYRPGAFFERELPCILAVLGEAGEAPDIVVVDGYVWLGAGNSRPGLGYYLHEMLGQDVPVIGVAKNPYAGADAVEALRGESARPLYITSVGIEANVAARHVRSMHGEHRIPTLLQRVDHLARGRE